MPRTVTFEPGMGILGSKIGPCQSCNVSLVPVNCVLSLNIGSERSQYLRFRIENGPIRSGTGLNLHLFHPLWLRHWHGSSGMYKQPWQHLSSRLKIRPRRAGSLPPPPQSAVYIAIVTPPVAITGTTNHQICGLICMDHFRGT